MVQVKEPLHLIEKWHVNRTLNNWHRRCTESDQETTGPGDSCCRAGAETKRGSGVRMIEGDLEKLSPDDLRRVCHWAEDRFVNAVTPLAVQLQLDERGGGEHTLAAARWAVRRILDAIDEVRRISAHGTPREPAAAPAQSLGPACAPIVPLVARRSLLPSDESLSL